MIDRIVCSCGHSNEDHAEKGSHVLGCSYIPKGDGVYCYCIKPKLSNLEYLEELANA